MKYVIVLLLIMFLMGCGTPISFMAEDEGSPEWVTELASTVGEGAEAESGKVGKGKWKEPVTKGTVEDMVVPRAEPAPLEQKPEWVAELEEEVTVVTVGKTSYSDNGIQMDLVGDEQSAVMPAVGSAGAGKKVDIIFVVDSSGSMDPFLRDVRQTFAGFIPSLSGLDWQMMFTTAERNIGSMFSQNGRAITLEDNGKLLVGQKYLTKETRNYQSVFLDTLGSHDASPSVRADGSPNRDTAESPCLLAPGCQDWNEKPLEALKASFSNNRSFFRSGADVAVVIFSDSDEGEETPPENRVRTQDVIDAFQTEWGGENKRLKVYGIITTPNSAKDEACRAKYSSGVWGGEGIVSVELARMVQATGGASMSLCDQSYAALAGRITNDFSDR